MSKNKKFDEKFYQVIVILETLIIIVLFAGTLEIAYQPKNCSLMLGNSGAMGLYEYSFACDSRGKFEFTSYCEVTKGCRSTISGSRSICLCAPDVEFYEVVFP